MGYLFLLEYCFNISDIFLAWVRDPPGDEIVTTIPYGLSQKVLFKPDTIVSVLYVRYYDIQFLINISLNSNS